ncbi:nitrite reductase small subunit NirD [Chryseolinea lacunae]|uniref:Nitrite reductase small subunit NirD n=1 Tax=Chryseolinea lacunae TaxID=2801331 RepID=A0ABS1L020_9BACT|nr:nitrite reductase small subunit NirD [Chryseolinea lacunae]MBL0744778.1 nitrite reductase small subunit NirD [Chryseolinea lacunae]
MEILNDIRSLATVDNDIKVWFKAARASDFPENGGACVKYKDQQIAVFNFARRSEWYACQNLCPHKMQMVLSRGIIGSVSEEPKVACPFHKKTFSLRNGECLNATEEKLAVFPVKIEDGFVYIGFAR